MLFNFKYLLMLSSISVVILNGIFLVTNHAQAAIPVYEMNTDKTYIQAALGHEIYFYSHDAQLRNLQVQDSQGNSLPFRVINLPDQLSTLEKESSAIFFPVAPNTSEDVLRTLSSTHIQINDSQVQVDIHRPSSELTPTTDNPDFYLIDLSAFQKQRKLDKSWKLTSLILQWNHQNTYQTWELFASNDLRNWHLLANTNLIWLEKEERSLIKNEIPLDINFEDYAYLKLRCVDFCQNIRVSQINIKEKSKAVFHASESQWALKGNYSEQQKSIKLHSVDNWQAKSVWDFKAQDQAEIEKLSINLHSHLYADKVRLLARNAVQDPWQLVYQGVWFNTKVGEEWYSSEPIILYQHHFAEFRLEFAANIPNDLQPELMFHAQAQAIQFIGNQSPPYQLTVLEQADSEAQVQIMNSLLRKQSPQWSYHQWVFLNPPKSEQSIVISWKSWVFWGLLLIALVLLAVLAVNLFKQMNIKTN